MQAFVMINNVGMMINADVNALVASGYFLCFNWYSKRMLFMLNLVLALKRQFNRLKDKWNGDQKSNLLFLQQHN